MSNIAKLLSLDKALVKPYVKYFLIILIAPLFVTLGYKNITSAITFAVVMISMTTSYTFSVAEKNDLNRLYGMLPVNKKEIVNARYLFTILLGIVLTIVFLVLELLIFTVAKLSFTVDQIVFGLGFAVIMYSIFTAVQLPGYFRFGAIKGRAFSFIPLIGLVAVGMIADHYNMKLNLAVLDNPYSFLAVSILGAVVIYGISIGITQFIYDRMEL